MSELMANVDEDRSAVKHAKRRDLSILNEVFSFALSEPPILEKGSLLTASAKFDVYQVSREEVDSFVFNDPFAPYNGYFGKLVHFKETESRVAEIARIVREKKSDHMIKRNEKLDKGMDNLSLAEGFNVPRSIFLSTIASGWMWTHAIMNNDHMLSTGGFIFWHIFLTAVLVFFVCLSSALITLAECKIYEVTQNNTRNRTPKMVTIGKGSDNGDSYYFIHGRSIVFSLLNECDEEIVAVISRKLALEEDDHDEVDKWASKVRSLLRVQSRLSTALPASTIPLMSEDVVIFENHLIEQLNKLEAEKLARKIAEAQARDHGRATSRLDESARDESKAILEGATVFAQSLGENDLVVRKD